MKKELISAFVIISLALNAQAQFIFNKTYSNSLSMKVRAVDHINAFVDGNSVMLSRNEDSRAPSGIILTKFDDQGGIIYERFWKVNGSVGILPDKLVFTADNGFIVVGRVSGLGGSINPFAAKFKYNGDHTAAEWAYEYTCNTGPWIPGRTEKVNIAKIKGSSEDFIIVTNGKPTDPVINSSYAQDAVVTALRINGADGTVIWSNKYEMPLAARLSAAPPASFGFGLWGTLGMLSTQPAALANGDGKSFIAGEVDWSTQFRLGYLGFYMAINDDGSVNQDYHFMDTWSSSNHHVIWDHLADGTSAAPLSKFILAYTASTSTIGPPVSRVVAVQKFNTTGVVTPDGPGPVTTYGVDHYHDGGQLLYSIGIDNKYSLDQYIISCWSKAAESSGVAAHAMLAIEKVPASPAVAPAVSYYSRFNINTPTSYYDMTPALSLLDKTLTKERNVMLGYVDRPSGVGGIRMISADLALNTCGAIPAPAYAVKENAGFSVLPHPQQSISVSMIPLTFTEDVIISKNDDCNDLPIADRDSYSTAISEQDAIQGIVDLYPTMITPDQHQLSVHITSNNNTLMEVSVITIDGKLLTLHNFDLQKGDQDLSFSLPELVPGTYIIAFSSADGKINRHIRVVKL